MSSVRRAISSAGIVDGRSTVSAAAGAATALPVSVLGSSVMWRHASRKKLLRLHQRLRKAVDLLARIVHGKGGAAGGRDAEARQKRHDAMGAGAHCHAGA